jgi:hypothetical protein
MKTTQISRYNIPQNLIYLLETLNVRVVVKDYTPMYGLCPYLLVSVGTTSYTGTDAWRMIVSTLQESGFLKTTLKWDEIDNSTRIELS